MNPSSKPKSYVKGYKDKKKSILEDIDKYNRNIKKDWDKPNDNFDARQKRYFNRNFPDLDTRKVVAISNEEC